jgi:nucleotide-binding universal stress UspA family protein
MSAVGCDWGIKMKLLLAVDSITTLNVLLDEMMNRSWPIGTEARVLSIVEDGEVPLETWREEGYGMPAVQQEMRRRGEQITALATARLREIGIPAEVVIMRGNPDFLITVAARRWLADLILIRAHNRSDFRDWLLGSVAKSVVEGAPCSVEIVRSRQADQLVINDSMRILLATDGSDVSLAASQALAKTSWPPGTEVKIVSVIDPILYSLEEILLSQRNRTERARRAIGQAISVLDHTSLKVSAEVIGGTIARQIIERAGSWNADLIVLGTHDRRGLKRLLLGSISTSVANRAHCSVRIIRQDIPRNEKSLLNRASPSARSTGSVYKSDESLGSKKAA